MANDKLVVNFGHILGERSLKFLQEKLGAFEYVHERLKIDFERPLVEQAVKAVSAAEGRCGRNWASRSSPSRS